MAFLQEYTMLDELGKGGFATVYKVRHNELGYIRAIRVLNEMITNSSSPTYQKFLRECKVLLRLGNGNHPNIVHIYQPRLLDNKALVEMDYVDGQDIMHYLKQNQNFVPVEDVIRMALQMSSTLAYCHEDIYRFCMDRDMDGLQDDPNDGSKVLIDDKTRQRLISKYKVIHNDIHSGNIMRRGDGNFVLLDFGLSIEGDEVVRSSRHANGAPEFKAPEKWDDDTILTEQSDIYSFGVVLYEYLAGRVPFPYDKRISNKTEAEYLLNKAHKNELPPSIEEIRKSYFERNNEGQEYKRDYPQWLEDVILKCLQKNPHKRFKNGKELFGAISVGIAQMSSKEEEALKLSLDKLQNELVRTQETLKQREEDLQNAQVKVQTQDIAFENERKDWERMQTGLQNRILELEEDIVRFKLNTGETLPPKKWKVISIILFFMLIVSGVGLWYTFSHRTPDNQQAIAEYEYTIDSLQLENARYQTNIDSLQVILRDSASDQVTSLTEALEEAKSRYDDLYARYSDLDTKYNNLRKNNSSSGDFKGHNAQYWYNNRLYKNHDAQYWYDENEKTKRQRDKYKKQLDAAI